ncbi:MAG TPA: integrin alpha, partial [Planctomycetota bacterium]|nr:integrin alpha [Planctomycetota bacterium]
LALASARAVTLLFGGERLPAEADVAELVARARGAVLFASGDMFLSVAGGADWNGDGILDLAVSEREAWGVSGRVRIVPGRRDWPEQGFLEDFPAWTSDVPDGKFGICLALSADLNGDGLGDLVVGAPGRSWRDDGHGYVIFGSGRILEESVENLFRLGFAARMDSFKPKDSLGFGSAALGDFNGDGIADFALSAGDGGVEFAGESYVVFGGPRLVPDPAGTPLSVRDLGAGGVRISGDRGYDRTRDVVPAGDFNGDGLQDVLVGASGETVERPTAYVVFGGPARHVSLRSLGGDGVRIAGDRRGDFHAGGGDFNGDGVDDIAIGGIGDVGGGGADDPSVVILFGERPAGQFLRGDSNGDGEMNLTDALATLGSLFFGTGDPPCVDAADADDSGRVEITDVIFLLGALFRGSEPIPSPHPGCGMDPTQDVLDCGVGCVGG